MLSPRRLWFFALTTFFIGGGGAAGCAAEKPAAPVDAAPTFTFKRGVNISHWLSQNFNERPYAANWFGEEDVAWIARQGFDHIRYPVDGRVWLKADGSLDAGKIAPFEAAMTWTRAAGLGVILDMHFLPGASFDPGSQESAVFTDEALQVRVGEFWKKVASRFASEGPWLRFELLNEPVATDNTLLNPFNRRMLAAVRESNPTRVVYVTSNRWSSFETIKDVELPDDANVALTLHFYEPFVFTHQRANWNRYPENMPAVRFPGKVPDLTTVLPADHFSQKASHKELTVAGDIDAPFAKVAAWVAKHAAGREIHIGEFGVYRPADDDSKRAYLKAVTAAAESRGWGWAVWDYKGGFAVRGEDGKGTAVLEGLFKR